jgi:hypothetical protein
MLSILHLRFLILNYTLKILQEIDFFYTTFLVFDIIYIYKDLSLTANDNYDKQFYVINEPTLKRYIQWKNILILFQNRNLKI